MTTANAMTIMIIAVVANPVDDGMSCSHCKACVEKAVRPLNGVVFAEADVASKSLHVEWHDDDDIDETALKTAVEEAGFEFVGAANA